MLLLWITQKKLQMIHRGWPFKVIQEHTAYTASTNQIPVTPRGLHPPEAKVKPTSPIWLPPHFPKKLQELCHEFKDILVTDLEANQQITYLKVLKTDKLISKHTEAKWASPIYISLPSLTQHN